MFDARQALADLNLEPYLFTDTNGVVRQLPHLKSLTTADVTRIYEGDALEVLPQVLSADAWTAISTLPVAALPALVADWAKHAEAAPGESAASSSSSASTARPSRRTSPGSTASRTRQR